MHKFAKVREVDFQVIVNDASPASSHRGQPRLIGFHLLIDWLDFHQMLIISYIRYSPKNVVDGQVSSLTKTWILRVMGSLFTKYSKAMRCEPFHLVIVNTAKLSVIVILADFSAVSQLFCSVQSLAITSDWIWIEVKEVFFSSWFVLLSFLLHADFIVVIARMKGQQRPPQTTPSPPPPPATPPPI